MPRETRLTSSRGFMGPEPTGEGIEGLLSPELRARVELLKKGLDPDTRLPRPPKPQRMNKKPGRKA